jgi:uncharacterized membrane protein YidH (DUF202 family)
MSAAEPTWSWANLPTGEATKEEDEGSEHAHGEEADHVEEEEIPWRPQKHYPTRTCRICLEEVLPTFDIPTGGMPSILQPTPRVKYISEDPESGRLLRPCKCRGSQKYVHEGCLNAWRRSNPAFDSKTYYECPTCKFKYSFERMRWGRYISSTSLQLVITVAIMFGTVFIFGFVADPIINLYLDPYETITSLPTGGAVGLLEYEDATWAEHFLKGLASLGLLGFVKVFFAMSPWNWWNLRRGGFLNGGRRQGGTGRDRLEDISWTVVIIGVITFLVAVWSWVRAWTQSALESAGERVLDVQGGDDDDDEVEELERTANQEVPVTHDTPHDASQEASSASINPDTPQDTPTTSNEGSETEAESRKTK